MLAGFKVLSSSWLLGVTHYEQIVPIRKESGCQTKLSTPRAAHREPALMRPRVFECLAVESPNFRSSEHGPEAQARKCAKGGRPGLASHEQGKTKAETDPVEEVSTVQLKDEELGPVRPFAIFRLVASGSRYRTSESSIECMLSDPELSSARSASKSAAWQDPASELRAAGAWLLQLKVQTVPDSRTNRASVRSASLPQIQCKPVHQRCIVPPLWVDSSARIPRAPPLHSKAQQSNRPRQA